MKMTELRIYRTASYETPANSLVGRIILEGDTGKQEIVLSARGISNLVACVQEEIQVTAKKNASMVEQAIDDAVDGALLLEQDGVIAIAGSSGKI